MNHGLKKRSAISVAIVHLLCSTAWATTDLTDIPMAVKNTVNPNIMFVLDDSGSMQFEAIPENDDVYFTFPRADPLYGNTWGYGGSFNSVAGFELSNKYARFYRTSKFNSLYYNPATRYYPWSNSDGSLMANASPTAACHNPNKCPAITSGSTSEGTLDLTTNHSWTASWRDDDGVERAATRSYYPATYFIYTPSGTDPTTAADANNTAAKFTLVEVKSTTASYAKAAGRTDCAGTSTCTYAEEIQNFANWYTFYRSRILLARAGVGKAFSKQGTSMRVGFGAINKGNATIDNVSTTVISRGVRDFTGTERVSFFSDFYSHPMPSAGTPLRSALDAAGQYFSRTDDKGPWGQFPGTGGGTQYSCRQNYTILMTDGYWNGGAAATAGAKLNVDNTAGTTKTPPAGSTLSPYTYAPGNPFSDAYSNTLADVAMYYWVNDIRSDMANKVVPPNKKDPAFWQHMVTFTVGLGVYGSIPKSTIDSIFTALNNNTAVPAVTWPDPTSGSAPNSAFVDDLAHAAINGRGNYFSAADPAAFTAALSDALDDIVERSGAAAAVAVANANVTAGDNASYASSYNSGTWTGDLNSYALDLATGVPATTSSWSSGSAQTQLDLKTSAVSSRYMVTYSGTGYSGSGLQFQPASVTIGGAIGSKLTSALDDRFKTPSQSDSTAVINYLRGDRSGETAGTYRTRAHLLGDIINSEPVVVRAPSLSYPDSGYLAFKTAQANRTKMVIQGANDGMIHFFNASTGAENWAYVPNRLIAENDPSNTSTSVLNILSRPSYVHRMYVDATPSLGDVDFNNTGGTVSTPDWHTIVVGGFGKGARGIYALDVTTPEVTSESDATNKVLWEFPNATTNSTVAANVGYIFGRPLIVRTKAQGWVVIVAAGYNNGTGAGNSGGDGHGYLFVLNAKTGALIKAIDTTVGTTAIPAGLNHITGYTDDADFNSLVPHVYGGDLLGNLWRFDISDADSNNWTVKRLAILKESASGTALTQAITTEPQLAVIPINGSYKRFVYVGTGRYLGDSDVTSSTDTTYTQQQTVYGLIDDLSNPAGITPVITDNLRTSLQAQTLTTSGSTRTVSNNTVDFTTKKGWYVDLDNPTTASERVVTTPALFYGALIFTSITPSDDACVPGGSSWFNVLDYKTGGQLTNSTVAWASTSLGNVLASRPILIKVTGGIKGLVRTSDGQTLTSSTGVPIGSNTASRASWREIQR